MTETETLEVDAMTQARSNFADALISGDAEAIVSTYVIMQVAPWVGLSVRLQLARATVDLWEERRKWATTAKGFGCPPETWDLATRVCVCADQIASHPGRIETALRQMVFAGVEAAALGFAEVSSEQQACAAVAAEADLFTGAVVTV